MIEKPEGVHNINTRLFFISFPQLHALQELAPESTNFDYSSAEYRVTAIILEITNYRLFRPVKSDAPTEKPKNFMKIKFLNKIVDTINLQHSYDQHQLLTKFQSTLKIKNHQLYHITVARKLFNFALTLSNLNVSDYLSYT